MAETRTIILVGHCGPDMYLLKSAINRAVPRVAIKSVNDSATVDQVASPDTVLLVNRILDGDFSDESGIELIRTLRGRLNPPVVMLISNHEDAQAEAVEAGALPGFGKSHLYLESTASRLRDAVTEKLRNDQSCY